MQDVIGHDRGLSATPSAEIARRLRSARARAGCTRKQLAAASGVSERYLAHLEAGTGNPSVEMLIAIAGALDLAIVELLPMGGERNEALAEATALIRRLPAERVAGTLARLRELGAGSADKAQRIALVGLRGAGKSSLGAALADRLGVPFFEVSKEIERLYGGPIAVLLDIGGPGALRRYEAEVLGSICRDHRAAVIAAPGAIVADAAVYDSLLASTWSIWLQASPADHMARVVSQGDLRPMAGTRRAMNDLKSILAARSAEYARAGAVLDTSAQDFAATAVRLEHLVQSLRT